MIDGIILENGTSRLARSAEDFKTRYPTYDAFAQALVEGTLPLDILFNTAGWSQLPHFLNKDTLLKDVTAALFGLDASAVPDHVLQVLSRFHRGLGNEYLWKSSESIVSDINYGEKKQIRLSAVQSTTAATTILYSDSLYIGSDGTVQLKPPVMSLNLSYNNAAANSATLNGKLFRIPSRNDTLYKGVSNLTFYTDDGLFRNIDIEVQTAYPVISEAGIVYHNAPNRDAFVDAENSGDYEFLGQLGGGAHIEVGTYIGNATTSGYRIIPLSFTPKAVFVCRDNGWIVSNYEKIYSGGFALEGYPVKTAAGPLAVEIVDNGFKVGYNPGSSSSVYTNYSGYTYYYIAFR